MPSWIFQGQLCTEVFSAYLDKVCEVEVDKLQTHDIESENTDEITL